MDELGLLEFNPYLGKKYREIYGASIEKGWSYMNLDPDEAVVNNPGFAPVYTTGPEVNGYACITGGFNENY